MIINGRKYIPIDEAGDDFSNVAETLRGVADNLEESDYSEEARLEAIKSLMPLVGQLRAGISVNEEGEEVPEEDFDEVPEEDTDEPVEENEDEPVEDESIMVINGIKYKPVDEKSSCKKNTKKKPIRGTK